MPATQHEDVVYSGGGLSGVEVLSVRDSLRRWCHFNAGYAFSAVDESASIIRYRRINHEARPGMVFCMEPGEIHVTLLARRPASFRTLFVARDLLEDVAGGAARFAATTLQDPVAFATVGQLCGAAGEPRATALAAGLRGLVAKAAEPPAHVPRAAYEPPSLRRARAYLHAHTAGDVALAELAQQAGVGRFHLLRLFRRHLGITPHAYHLHVRLAAARPRLSGGELGVHLAGALGFCDQGHFSRAFSRAFGITPRKYSAATRLHTER